jgi:hypothetical protein
VFLVPEEAAKSSLARYSQASIFNMIMKLTQVFGRCQKNYTISVDTGV